MGLTKEETLALINSMEIIDADETGSLHFVYIRDNEENRTKLAKIVPNVESYVDKYSSDESMYWGDADLIDIQTAAWVYAKADYFDGKQFAFYNREKLDSLLHSPMNFKHVNDLEKKLNI